MSKNAWRTMLVILAIYAVLIVVGLAVSEPTPRVFNDVVVVGGRH